MKTRASLFTILLLLFTVAISSANENIKGNKNIVTKTVSISDYDEISIAGQMEFIYEQSSSAPYFEITIDENVYPYIRVEVSGKKLIVGPKQDGNRRYNIQPTVYKIKTNSRDLKKLDKAGSGDFIVQSTLKANALNISSAGSGSVKFMKDVTGDNIKISMAGSGDVISNASFTVDKADINMAGSGSVKLLKQLTADDIKLSMAGSGEIVAKGINVETANCSLSSSGQIKVDGTAKEIIYSLTGSGEIRAFDCKANQVKSMLTGSGKIELYAIDQLNASIMGSGHISHKGNASVQSVKQGSGSIRHIN